MDRFFHLHYRVITDVGSSRSYQYVGLNNACCLDVLLEALELLDKTPCHLLKEFKLSAHLMLISNVKCLDEANLA